MMVEGEQMPKWYLAALNACPYLQEVNLHFSTQAELDALLRALRIISPSNLGGSPQTTSPATRRGASLREIVFGDLLWNDEQGEQLRTADIFATIGRTDLTSLDSVSFHNIPWSPDGSAASTPLFPLPARHVKVSTTTGRLNSSIILLPTVSCTIEQFEFNNFIIGDPPNLRPLSSFIGSNLRALNLSFNQFFRRSPSPNLLSRYPSIYGPSPLTLGEPKSFPLLRSLELGGTQGLSLRSIRTLSQSAPLLATMNFAHSRWVCDSNPASVLPDAIFPEEQVLKALHEFSHLVSVDLGLLPTLDSGRYEGLKETLQAHGVETKYRICDWQ